jgi:outer membrane protein assembly factor BamC
MYKPLLILSLVMVLTGCKYLTGENGLFRDRDGDYREAQALPQMQIPDELDSYTLDQLYVIPEHLVLTTQPFEEIPRPQPIETNRQGGVVIQNLGEKRWVVLDAAPGQVWTLVRDFWAQLQVVLDYENPSSGIMETSWLEVEHEQEIRHKYRITIEPGLHSGYSEIYVLHLQGLRSDPLPLIVNWPEASSSLSKETLMLGSLSQYLADRNDVYQASSASLLAGSIEAARKANIIDDDQRGQVLELRLAYERAWALVRASLKAAQIEIVDSDPDQSLFTIRFSGEREEQDRPGFIGRLFGRNNSDSIAEEKSFAVRLLEEGDIVTVVAEPLEASADLTELTAELLRVITNNLS